MRNETLSAAERVLWMRLSYSPRTVREATLAGTWGGGWWPALLLQAAERGRKATAAAVR